jgi:hypothetical protein
VARIRACAIAALLVTGCATESDAFSRRDAVVLVMGETGVSSQEAECIVGGMVDDGPFVPRDFLDDEDSDPRFASSFERIASECLL